MVSLLAIIAEGQQKEAGPPGFATLMPFLLIGMLFIFIVFLPQRRQQRQMRDMLGALKRNDKVVTSSGIIGVVVEVREKPDEDIKENEVVLRVDDSSNTRMRVLRSTIARVIPVGPISTETKK